MQTIQATPGEHPQTLSRCNIRLQDCDPTGHLNNGKYFEYFFRARDTAMAEMHSLSPADVYAQFGCTWVTYNHHIAYIRPARPGEKVEITSRLLYYDEDTLLVEFFMTDLDRKELKSLLWSTLKFVNHATGEKSIHPEEIRKIFKKTRHPGVNFGELLFENISWQDRIRKIRSEIQA